MALTKKQLVEKLALSTDIVNGTNAGASRVLELLIDTIKTELSQGGSVDISGLCKFSTATQAAKSGTVPGTTKTYSSPAKTVVKIKASKSLRDSVL